MAEGKSPLTHGALNPRRKIHPPQRLENYEVGYANRATNTECTHVPHEGQQEEPQVDDEEERFEHSDHRILHINSSGTLLPPTSVTRPFQSTSATRQQDGIPELSQADIIKQLFETVTIVKQQGRMLQRLMERHEALSPEGSYSSATTQRDGLSSPPQLLT